MEHLSRRSLVVVCSLLAVSLVLTSTREAAAQELSQVFDAPSTGTFFLMSGQTEEGTSPPYPFDPYGGTIPIYQVAGFGGAFLVADTAEDYVLYQAVMQERRWSLSSVAWGEGGGMMLSSEEGPPGPPGGGEGGGKWNGSEFIPMVFGFNDLWLEITNWVAGTGDFIIHAPEPAAHDLFLTTNLTLTVPGLNATNWVCGGARRRGKRMWCCTISGRNWASPAWARCWTATRTG